MDFVPVFLQKSITLSSLHFIYVINDREDSEFFVLFFIQCIKRVWIMHWSNMFILLQILNVFWNFTLHQSIFYFLKVTRSILNKILLLGLKIWRYWISRLLTSLGWLHSFMRISFPSSIITIPFQLNRSLNKIYFRQSKVLQLLLWFLEADHCLWNTTDWFVWKKF